MSSKALGRPLSAVIYDMDGLIVDSEPIWRAVQTRTFDELGADIRPYLGHGHTMGLRVDEAIAHLVEASGLNDVDQDEVVRVVVEGIVEGIETRSVLMPGVLESIEFFESIGLRPGLASGSTPPVIEAVLERFDLARHFRVVSSAINDHFGKPHPSIFLRTAKELGSLAGETLVLEDSLNGVIAAKAARMAVIAVPDPDDAGDPRFAIADVMATSLLEIPKRWPFED